MLTGAGRTLTWTSFNQLRTVAQGGQTSEFWFGAGHERVLQKNSNGTTTVYVGSMYEFVTNPDGLKEFKDYIMTPLGRTAVHTVRTDSTVETRYLHQDALGSIDAVSDEYGRVEKRFTYDAWGKRATALDTHTGSGGKVTRGYTDHEMLDDFGLIHMNGRVYDPVLARFTSADPHVKDPTDAGSFNRYSYCHNEPMRLTDPTGFDDVSSGSDSPWFLDWGDGGGSGNYGWSPTYGVDSSGGGTVGNWSISSLWSYSQNSYWAKSPDTYNLSIGSSSSGGSSMDAGSLINFGSVGTSFQSGTVGSAPGLPAFGFNGFTLPDVPRWINPDGTFNPNARGPNSTTRVRGESDTVIIYNAKAQYLNPEAATAEDFQQSAFATSDLDPTHTTRVPAENFASILRQFKDIPDGSISRLDIEGHDVNLNLLPVQTIGDNVPLTPDKMALLAPKLAPGAIVTLYGCGVGTNQQYLNNMSAVSHGATFYAPTGPYSYNTADKNGRYSPLQNPVDNPAFARSR